MTISKSDPESSSSRRLRILAKLTESSKTIPVDDGAVEKLEDAGTPPSQVLECSDGLEKPRAAIQALVGEKDRIREAVERIQLLNEQIQKENQELQEECREIMGERENLLQSAERIAKEISYFTDAKKISLALQSNQNLVDDSPEELAKLLDRIDQCIEFLELHSDYKDAKKSLAQFRHLQHLALSRVKKLLVLSLKNSGGKYEIDSEQNDPRLRETSIMIDLRAAASGLRPLIQFVQEKAQKMIRYRELLLECRQSYYEQRHINLYKAVQKHLEETSKSLSLMDFTRNASLFMVQKVNMEFQIFHEFFPRNMSSEIEIDHVLESHLKVLGGALYMHLRPRVIHEMDLDVLCDLYNILFQEILRDQVLIRGEAVSVFIPMIQRLLQDLEERLVYLTQIFLRDQIRGHIGDDLDSSIVQKDPETNNHGGWYSTLEKTLLCLSKLFQCLSKPVFDLIAQDAISACLYSLRNASERIFSENPLDRELFLVQQLLTLRDQIIPFEIDHAVTEAFLDFSETKNFFAGILKGRFSLLSFLNVGAPKLRHSEQNNIRVSFASCSYYILFIVS